MLESSKICLQRRQFALARGLIQRAIDVRKKNRDAHQLHALLSLLTNCSKKEQLSNIKRILMLSSPRENASAESCYESARLFSMISDSENNDVLRMSLNFASLACEADPSNVSFHIEKANILLRLNDLKESYELFHYIVNTHDDSIEALLGCVLCQMLRGENADANNQLEFISMMEMDDEDQIAM